MTLSVGMEITFHDLRGWVRMKQGPCVHQSAWLPQQGAIGLNTDFILTVLEAPGSECQHGWDAGEGSLSDFFRQ